MNRKWTLNHPVFKLRKINQFLMVINDVEFVQIHGEGSLKPMVVVPYQRVA